MIKKRGTTFQVSSFVVNDPPSDGVVSTHSWLAIATAQVYDPSRDVGGLTNQQAILAGEVMRSLSGRASASTEKGALVAAVCSLLELLADLEPVADEPSHDG